MYTKEMKGALSLTLTLLCTVASVLAEEGLDNAEYARVYFGFQDGSKEADRITELPGQPDGITFIQYAGYVTVDPTAGRALFYYFAESEFDSSVEPLVLWLNGGPGCSSLGAGAFKELGPFHVNSDGRTLWHNTYAWNTAANVLFLESPAGVGFSYSNTSSDYVTGDNQTAADSYTFLVNWLERFPEYKTRDFFLTGESYAGHYLPQLAQLILKNNKITGQTVINLRGIAIGNAFVDYETQQQGRFDYLWTHALISDEIYQGVISNCNFSIPYYSSDICDNYKNQSRKAKGNIDPYNIYAPVCHSSSSLSSSGIPPSSVPEVDPCSHVSTYLNTGEVQRSLHANTTGLPGLWQSCNEFTGSHWLDKPTTVLPVIQELSESGINVWLYSGDIDSVVPVSSTRYAIKKMGLSVKTPWYPWYSQGEVGGYAVGYENLTFVTVRGAGHLVPTYQPGRALTLFTSFLEGVLPPST